MRDTRRIIFAPLPYQVALAHRRLAALRHATATAHVAEPEGQPTATAPHG